MYVVFKYLLPAALLAVLVTLGRQLGHPERTPMDVVFKYLIPAALLAVLVTLGFGLYALFRGGEFGRSHSNRLMRLRVLTQAVAVAILAAALWWRQQAG